MPHNPWSKVLVEMRDQKRLTQEQAAEGAGVVKNTWYRWENTNFNPTDKNLKKAAEGLGCEIEDLKAAHKAAMPDAFAAASAGAVPGTRTELDQLRAGESMAHSIGRLLGEEVASDPLIERLLGRAPEEDPDLTPQERSSELLQHVKGRTQVLVAATTHILTDLFLCYPQVEAVATEEEKEHFSRIYTDLLSHLSLSRSMTESLQDISSLRFAAQRAAQGEDPPPEDD